MGFSQMLAIGVVHKALAVNYLNHNHDLTPIDAAPLFDPDFHGNEKNVNLGG